MIFLSLIHICGINYAIDLNLVAVQDAVISITNTRFEGNCGASGPIKVAERGTGDGTEADDITGARASVKSLTISGCTFNNSNPILGGDIVLGVTTKTVSYTHLMENCST